MATLQLQPSEMVILKFPILIFLVAVGFVSLGCAKNFDGNTSFKEASKGFEKELPAEKRKQAIKALQTETDAAEHARMTAG